MGSDTSRRCASACVCVSEHGGRPSSQHTANEEEEVVEEEE